MEERTYSVCKYEPATGWIDGTLRTDDNNAYQQHSKRKPVLSIQIMETRVQKETHVKLKVQIMWSFSLAEMSVTLPSVKLNLAGISNR